MASNEWDRRGFLKTASAGTAGVALGTASLMARDEPRVAKGTLAILGGKPVRKEPFASWPLVKKSDEEAWSQVLEAKKWCRLDGQEANKFEREYAKVMGTGHCLATTSGTTALLTSLNALEIGPGDEVIVPPYTFVATINVVLLQHALPVFVDSDRQTFQIDAGKIEAAITERTRCILPVHLGGNAADLDTIMAVAKKHSLPVLEDTCQSHLAEWKGKKLGSVGKAGCFSFQVTKNLSGGEGGAIITDDAAFAERCYAFHNQGHGRIPKVYPQAGANFRMTEFQAALLQTQMTRIEEQAQVRSENAAYLTKQLEEIPGIYPAKRYPGCTRNAYHLYMFRYDKDAFAGALRRQFLKALSREGIPCAGGYSPLNKQPFLRGTLRSRGFQAVYGPDRLRGYEASNHCPENDRLCDEAVWLFQNMLLGPRSDMDQIAEAVRKIHSHAADLARV